jgi:Tfp pilus assembly protein PilF
MTAGSRSKRCGICHERTKCGRYSKKVNQLSWLVFQSGTPHAGLVLILLLILLLVLTSLSTVAQTPGANRRTLIYGLIVTAQGLPVARATVEVRDLRGIKMAAGFTDIAGRFAITMGAKLGEYVIVAAKELQIGDERITLDRLDREVTIALPAASASAAATSLQMYTVSAQELRMPAKVRAHLKVAHEKFSKSNFAGAEREIDQALQADSICAAAFSMRALLRLSSRDFEGAIEDATRALALDPTDADAYLALATAYNSLAEFGKAETAAQQALGMRPAFWQGRLELAKSFYGEGRFILALRELDELNKDFPDVHLIRADVLQCLQRSPEAAEEFSQFLREAPNDPRSGQIRQIVNQVSGTAMLPSSGQ